MTFPERELWYHFLKDYPVRFRRQAPLGNYIADFYCAKAKLVIELDGYYHGIEQQMAGDALRTKDLEKMGQRVLRFQNKDVVKNLYGVTMEIDRVVKERLEQRETTPPSACAATSPGKGRSNRGPAGQPDKGNTIAKI